VKMFGTRSSMCLSQHICCTNMIAKHVINFYHIVIKVHINYECSTKQTKLNVQSLIDLTADTMLHKMKGIGNG
jgi:hypothetical protein